MTTDVSGPQPRRWRELHIQEQDNESQMNQENVSSTNPYLTRIVDPDDGRIGDVDYESTRFWNNIALATRDALQFVEFWNRNVHLAEEIEDQYAHDLTDDGDVEANPGPMGGAVLSGTVPGGSGPTNTIQEVKIRDLAAGDYTINVSNVTITPGGGSGASQWVLGLRKTADLGNTLSFSGQFSQDYPIDGVINYIDTTVQPLVIWSQDFQLHRLQVVIPTLQLSLSESHAIVLVGYMPQTPRDSYTITVSYSGYPKVVGPVSVSNFPVTQAVSGSVDVLNFPAVQQIEGSITVEPSTDPTPVSIVQFNAQSSPIWISDRDSGASVVTYTPPPLMFQIDQTVYQSEADSANREMHALNGNTEIEVVKPKCVINPLLSEEDKFHPGRTDWKFETADEYVAWISAGNSIGCEEWMHFKKLMGEKLARERKSRPQEIKPTADKVELPNPMMLVKTRRTRFLKPQYVDNVPDDSGPAVKVTAGCVSSAFSDVENDDIEQALLEIYPESSRPGAALRFFIFGDVPKEENPFSSLDIDDVPTEIEEVPTKPQVKSFSTRAGGPATRKESFSALISKAGSLKASNDVKKPVDPNVLLKQRESVTGRIVQKLKSGGDDAVVSWLMKSPPTRFAYEITCLVWGKSWVVGNSWQRWFATCRLQKTGNFRALEMAGYSIFLPRIAELTAAKGWAAWFESEFKEAWANFFAVSESEAVAHNGMMHAYNGNPIFSQTMSSVKQNPNIDSLYDTSVGKPGPHPWSAALTLSTLPCSVAPRQLDVPTQMPFYADLVNAANAVVKGLALAPCESLLFPRTVRGTNGETADSVQPLCPLTVGTMSYRAGEIVDTQLALDIIESALKANMVAGRADSVTLQGFHAFDAAYICRMKSYQGYSPQTILMKLLCLSMTNDWARERSRLPLCMEASKYDPRTKLSSTGALSVGYNNSPVFDEDVGGSTAVLPFRGGSTGEIFFHITLESVPESERQLAVFCPSNLLLADQEIGLSIFFFVTMWADWPTLMWTVTLPTTDTSDLNPDNQAYIPFISNVFIPGMTRLHIILPRRAASRNPTSQVESNTQAMIRPICGSTASASFTAGQELNVNYVGGTLTGYNMAEYCYTWGQNADTTSIVQFLQRLNDLTDIKDDVKFTFDQLAAVGVRYPPLVAQAPGATAVLAVDSAVSGVQITPLGYVIPPVSSTWPQSSISRPDFMIYNTDIVAWNKTVLGVGLAEGKLGTGCALTPMLADPQCMYWIELLARFQAVTTCVDRSYLGWSAGVWNTAYTNSDSFAFRETARTYFTSASGIGLATKPAQQGKALAGLYTGLLGFSPHLDAMGDSVFGYVSPPRSTNLTTIFGPNDEIYDNTVPVFLPDTWIHATCEKVPIFMSSFPPQNNEDSTTGLCPSGYRVSIAAGGTLYGAPILSSSFRDAVGKDELRDDTEEEIWNVRLGYLINNQSIVADQSTTPIANSLTGGILPRSGECTEDYSIGTVARGVAACCTYFIARVLPDCACQYIFYPRATAIQMMRIMMGQARASIEIWSVCNVIPYGDMTLNISTGVVKGKAALRARKGEIASGKEQAVEVPAPSTANSAAV